MLSQIKSRTLTASIQSKGAELCSLKDNDGIEYIWQADPHFWGSHAPILFPIVGSLRDNKTIIEGKEYQMRQHGFARESEFSLVSVTQDSVEFSLKYNDATLQQYPFRFDLRVIYTITEEMLLCTFRVINLDTKTIYFNIGGHPGIRCPLDQNERFEDYVIEFEQDETADCPQLNAKREVDLNNRLRVLEGSRRISLSYSWFTTDALIFLSLFSRKVKLVKNDGIKGVEIDFNGFDYLGIWTTNKGNAPYVCLEPWNGVAICTDEGNEFIKRRGVIALECDRDYQVSFSLKILR